MRENDKDQHEAKPYTPPAWWEPLPILSEEERRNEQRRKHLAKLNADFKADPRLLASLDMEKAITFLRAHKAQKLLEYPGKSYAEMAHSSRYKPPIRIPEEDQKHVNRALAKGSALIETTDEVFGQIKRNIRDYNSSVSALLEASSEIYQRLTGEQANAHTQVGELIAEAYRPLLKGVTPADLGKWAEDREWLGKALKGKRYESVFYRDSIVILLGFLVMKHEMTLPKAWPMDSGHLEDLYRMLGVSTDGLF